MSRNQKNLANYNAKKKQCRTREKHAIYKEVMFEIERRKLISKHSVDLGNAVKCGLERIRPRP